MNITPFDPAKDTVVPLPVITEKLHNLVNMHYGSILQHRREMEDTTGEMRDAYELVLKNKVWLLTTAYFKCQNELVAQTVELERESVKPRESEATANCESISNS